MVAVLLVWSSWSGAVVVRAQQPARLPVSWDDVAPPTEIAGLEDARPIAPLEFSRAWLGKVEEVRRRRDELLAEGKLDGLTPAAAARLGAALHGTLNVPVIPVRYRDVAPPFPVSVLQTRLFGAGSGDTVSYAGYWDQVSDGLLRVEGVVAPWVRLPHRARHYLSSAEYGWASFGRIGELRQEAIRAVDRDIDFGAFDNDGPDGIPNSGDDDGFVDFVAFVYAIPCPGDGREGAIWPHRAAMAPLVTNDPAAHGGFIKITDYVILPALDPATCGPLEVGVLAHETGHALGLPDLYDYDGSSQGIGAWGLMGTGSNSTTYSPAHLSGWAKEQLGWVTVDWLKGDDDDLRIPPVETAHTVFRYDDPDSSGVYLLLENRQQVGSDAHLPGHGLLAWRVDPERGELGAWNSDERRTALSLLAADGRDDLGHGLRADPGDPYPGHSERTLLRPAMAHGFQLSAIRESGGDVVADLRLGYYVPTLVPRSPVTRITALAGAGPVSEVVAVAAEGGAARNWDPVPSAPWLQAQRAANAVVITAHPRGLAPGEYSDTVRLFDRAGKALSSILVSFYVATPGMGQIVATALPWSWGLAVDGGSIYQASYGWDPLGLRPRPRILQLDEGATHPFTLARLPADALFAPVIDRRRGAMYVLARAQGKNYLYEYYVDGEARLVAADIGTDAAYGAAALPDGSILVAEWSGRVHRVDRDGQVTFWRSLGSPVYQIAADDAGNVFAAGFDGRILRIPRTGPITRLTTGFGRGRLVALAVTPAGDCFAAERGGAGRILRIAADGQRQEIFRRDGAQFYGIAVDNLFVYALDLGHRELLRIPLPPSTRTPTRYITAPPMGLH